MTQTDWIKGKDPNAMLSHVRQFLGRRRWQLFNVSLARRVESLIPPGKCREWIDYLERNADKPRNPETMVEAQHQHLESNESAQLWAMLRQREIVLAANPDAEATDFTHGQPRQTNPATPLFQAASEAANGSITSSGVASRYAVSGLFFLLENLGAIEQHRALMDAIQNALTRENQANASAASALKLKQLGDDWADRENGRNVGHRYSAALDMVRREQEQLQRHQNNAESQAEKSLNRTMAQILHEMVGNPFVPVPNIGQCRSSDVIDLATTIDANKRYELMPILADALLEADCEEESVLRHCRGNEEPLHRGVHSPGCWVIDLILDRDVDFFAKVQMKKHSRRQLRTE